MVIDLHDLHSPAGLATGMASAIYEERLRVESRYSDPRRKKKHQGKIRKTSLEDFL